MPRHLRTTVSTVILAGLFAACLAACTEPPDDSPKRLTEERLWGTWLREYDEGGVRVRRVLVLQPDGTFSERSLAGDEGHPILENSSEGEWIYDGTNLKRRYKRMNGRQPSAPMVPFATFELRFESRDEFVGVDNVHRREVVYHRVEEGTRP